MPLLALPRDLGGLPRLVVAQLESGFHGDLEIVCKGGTLVASQALLAPLSPMIYSLVQSHSCCGCGGRKCSKREVVSLQVDLAREVMIQVLWLCHTGEVILSKKEEADAIREALRMLGISLNLDFTKTVAATKGSPLAKIENYFCGRGTKRSFYDIACTRVSKRSRREEDPVKLQSLMARELSSIALDCNVPGCTEPVSLATMTQHFSEHVAVDEAKEKEQIGNKPTSTVLKCSLCAKEFKFRKARDHHMKTSHNSDSKTKTNGRSEVNKGPMSNPTSSSNPGSIQGEMDTNNKEQSSTPLGAKNDARQHVLAISDFFKAHPHEVQNYKGQKIDQEQAEGLPPRWGISVKVKEGRKHYLYVSPEKMLTFRSRSCVVEYLKILGDTSEEDLEACRMFRGKSATPTKESVVGGPSTGSELATAANSSKELMIKNETVTREEVNVAKISEQKDAKKEDVNKKEVEKSAVLQDKPTDKILPQYVPIAGFSKCQLCDKEFKRFCELRNHYTTVHFLSQLKAQYADWGKTCYFCFIEFSSNDLLLTHMGNFHCAKSIDLYLLHDGCRVTTIEWTSKLLNTTCGKCGKGGMNSSALKFHMSTVHFAKQINREFPFSSRHQLKCSKCKLTFPNTGKRTGHIGSVHDEVLKYAKEIIDVCEADNNIIPVNMFEEKGTAVALSEDDPNVKAKLTAKFTPTCFSCRKCPQTFETRDLLKNHIAMKHYYDKLSKAYSGTVCTISPCGVEAYQATSNEELIVHIADKHEKVLSFLLQKDQISLPPNLDKKKESQPLSPQRNKETPKNGPNVKIEAGGVDLLKLEAMDTSDSSQKTGQSNGLSSNKEELVRKPVSIQVSSSGSKGGIDGTKQRKEEEQQTKKSRLETFRFSSCEMETGDISKEDVGPKAKGEVKDAAMIRSGEKEKCSEKDIRALFDSDSE